MRTIYSLIIALILVSCQNQEKIDVEKAKQASIDSMKVEIQKQKVIDSMKVEMVKVEEEKAEAQRKAEAQKVVHVQQPATTTEKKRKGWSSTAKGAVIGAGVGAITGAAVSKKKGEGAIIGGLAGAGVGAGTGAIIDNEKKKKE